MQVPGAFAGLQTALRGLQAGQRGMDVVGRNINGASDPNHTRLEVESGSGATDALVRKRDLFLDQDYRRAAGTAASSRLRQESLGRIEAAFAEPSDQGLQQYLDRFWTAWQQLAGEPANLAVRAQVVMASTALATRVRQVAGALETELVRLNEALVDRVGEVNNQTARVATLNSQILSGRAAGRDVSALLDARDAALDRLAALGGVAVQEQGDGQVAVYMGGHPLVTGANRFAIRVDPAGSLIWDPGGAPALAPGGELGGILAARDGDLAQLRSELDLFAQGLADAVNAEHRQGYGLDPAAGPGRDLFRLDGGAASLALAPGITPETLAVAGSPDRAPADGTVAAAIAGAREAGVIWSPLYPLQPLTTDQHYRSVVGRLGMLGQAARQQQEAAGLDLQAAGRARQAEWGVSLDEEAASLLQHQKALAAAARVVSFLDEALDTIINRMGAGR